MSDNKKKAARIIYVLMIMIAVLLVMTVVLINVGILSDNILKYVILCLSLVPGFSFTYTCILKELHMGGVAYTKEDHRIVYSSHLIFCVIIIIYLIIKFKNTP